MNFLWQLSSIKDENFLLIVFFSLDKVGLNHLYIIRDTNEG